MTNAQRMAAEVIEQVAEQNLRIRFLMEMLKVTIAPKTLIVGTDDRPITHVVTAWEFYQLQGREQVLALLTAELKEREEMARVEREAETASPEGAEEDGPSTPLAFAARRDTH